MRVVSGCARSEGVRTYVEGDVEGSDESDDIQEETQVRSIDTKHGGEWQLIKLTASKLPRAAVADVGQVDGSPGEEGGESRQGQQPVESDATLWCQGDVCEESEDQRKSQGNVWATVLVNAGEDPWCHAVESQSLDGTGGSVGTGVGDGDDGKSDNGVEDVWHDGDIGQAAGADHWGVLGVGSGCALEGWVIRRDDEAEDEERDDVEDGDTPENLLGGLWKGLSRVVGLSSGETNQLSTSEGESGGDEDGTPSLESVLESRPVAWSLFGWWIGIWVGREWWITRIVLWWRSPVSTSNVSSELRLVIEWKTVGLGYTTNLLSVGTPPTLMTIPMMMNPITAMTLMAPRMNSTSP